MTYELNSTNSDLAPNLTRAAMLGLLLSGLLVLVVAVAAL